jgi:hypothetical protein
MTIDYPHLNAGLQLLNGICFFGQRDIQSPHQLADAGKNPVG